MCYCNLVRKILRFGEANGLVVVLLVMPLNLDFLFSEAKGF